MAARRAREWSWDGTFSFVERQYNASLPIIWGTARLPSFADEYKITERKAHNH